MRPAISRARPLYDQFSILPLRQSVRPVTPRSETCLSASTTTDLSLQKIVDAPFDRFPTL